MTAGAATAATLGLAKFGQHTVGRLRVQERNELVARAVDRRFMNELGAGRFGLGELANDVVAAKSHVMDAFAILREELRNGAIIRSRFEQFNVHFADGKEGGADFLRRHFLAVLALEAENGLVIFDGFVEGTNGNAEVVDFLDAHGRLTFFVVGVSSHFGGEDSLINLIG